MNDLNKKCVFLNQDLNSKEEVLEFLSKKSVELGFSKKESATNKAFLEREAQISTGLEDEFAIPHAKTTDVLMPGMLYVTLKNGVEWETFDNSKVKYVISFLIPSNGGDAYLQKLAVLSGNLADINLRKKLKKVKNPEGVVELFNDFFKPESKEIIDDFKSDKIILGIAACPAGLAHTYMAKKSIEDACAKLGYKCKVEAHGSLGVENKITKSEIEDAMFLIKACDVEVDEDNRFGSLFKYKCSTIDFIKNKEIQLTKAIDAYEKSAQYNEAPKVVFKTKKTQAPETQSNSFSGKLRFFGKDVLKHLMTGIGYCIPLLIGCGFMIGISQLLAMLSVENSIKNFPGLHEGTLDVRDWVSNVKGWNGFLWTLNYFGMNIGLGYLFITLLGGFIGYSMNGKAGLAPSLVAGFVSIIRNTGFIGAVLTTLTVGYIIKFVIKFMTPKGRLKILSQVVFVPFFGFLSAIALGWWVYGFPLEWINVGLQKGLTSLAEQDGLLLLFCIIVAGMIAFDLGGPVNKSALSVCIVLWADTNNSDILRYVPYTAVHIAIVVPPLGVAVATWLAPKYFTTDDKTKANSSFISGLFGISEGAIPFLLKAPLRSILVNVTGAIVAVIPCALAKNQMLVGAGPVYGWVFVSNGWLYMLCVVLGAVWVGAWMAFFQKRYFHKKTNTKWINFYSRDAFANSWITVKNVFLKKDKKLTLRNDKFSEFLLQNKININEIENY